MERAQFTDEQILRILQEADQSPVVEVAKRNGVPVSTIHCGGHHRLINPSENELIHPSRSLKVCWPDAYGNPQCRQFAIICTAQRVLRKS
jgi:hypothetical protein